MSDRVQVFVRVRPRIKGGNPLHSAEWHHRDAVARNGENNIVISEIDASSGKASTQEFVFDGIFEQDSTQEEVYEVAAMDALDAGMGALGCSCIVFAYGQSGAGKSHTMLGRIKETGGSASASSPLMPSASPLVGGGSFPPSASPTTPSLVSPGAAAAAASPICPDSGMLLRVLQDLLVYKEHQRKAGLFQIYIGINVMEVYLDNVRDLLSKDPSESLKVLIVDESVQIPDLTYREVHSLQDALKAYNDASRRRVSRATDANDSSSRSHALFHIDVFRVPLAPLSVLASTLNGNNNNNNNNNSNSQKQGAVGEDNDGNDTGDIAARTASPIVPVNKERIAPTFADIVTARNLRKQTSVPSAVANCGLFPSSTILMVRPAALTSDKQPAPLVPVFQSRVGLVDLAGSEKMKNVNSKGDALEEMKKINQSLTSLGNVVHALHQNSKHIPYRDSRLTVLLRDGFASPGARIVLIANCAPTSVCHDETLSTLLFANKVKAMKADKNSAGAAGSAAELALQALFTEMVKKFDAHACDLRIWSAGFSPSEDKTKALRMLRDQHMKNSIEKKLSPVEEMEQIGALIRAMAEDSRTQRTAEAETMYRELPQRQLVEYRRKCSDLRATIQQLSGGQGGIMRQIQEIESQMPALTAELESRNPAVAARRETARELGSTIKSLDDELRQMAESLVKMSIITDPETLALKAEAAQETQQMQAAQRQHDAMAPVFDLLRARHSNFQSLLSAFQHTRDTRLAIEVAERDQLLELSRPDAETVRARCELLTEQFDDEMLSSPWLTREQSSAFLQKSSPGQSSPPSARSNSVTSPALLSPTASAAAAGARGDRRGSGSPEYQLKDINVYAGGRSMSVTQAAAASSSSPSSLSPQQIDNFFASSMAANSTAGLNARSASVGLLGLKIPPPPPLFDKNGLPLRGPPMLGKKITPPPPRVPTSTTVGPDGKPLGMAPALVKYLHHAPAPSSSAQSSSPASLTPSPSFSSPATAGGGFAAGRSASTGVFFPPPPIGNAALRLNNANVSGTAGSRLLLGMLPAPPLPTKAPPTPPSAVASSDSSSRSASFGSVLKIPPPPPPPPPPQNRSNSTSLPATPASGSPAGPTTTATTPIPATSTPATTTTTTTTTTTIAAGSGAEKEQGSPTFSWSPNGTKGPPRLARAIGSVDAPVVPCSPGGGILGGKSRSKLPPPPSTRPNLSRAGSAASLGATAAAQQETSTSSQLSSAPIASFVDPNAGPVVVTEIESRSNTPDVDEEEQDPPAVG